MIILFHDPNILTFSFRIQENVILFLNPVSQVRIFQDLQADYYFAALRSVMNSHCQLVHSDQTP